MEKYLVTVTATYTIEAETPEEAATVARELLRLGEAPEDDYFLYTRPELHEQTTARSKS